MQLFPRRHVQRQQQQVTRTAHVEGIFGEMSNIAFHDRQIICAVDRGLGVIGAVDPTAPRFSSPCR